MEEGKQKIQEKRQGVRVSLGQALASLPISDPYDGAVFFECGAILQKIKNSLLKNEA